MCNNAPTSPCPSPIASVHLVDATIAASLRRRPPQVSAIEGLHSLRKVVASPFNGREIPSPQPSRSGFVAFWRDSAALDGFLDQHAVADELRRGWMVRLQPLRATGAWPGVSVLLPDAVDDVYDGIVAGLTIGNLRTSAALGFARLSTKVERQIMHAPGLLWGTNLAGFPRLLATLSFWQSSEIMSATLRTGAHASAVRESVRAAQPPPITPFADGTTFFTESAFVRFRPYAVEGEMAGRNGFPELDLPSHELICRTDPSAPLGR